MFTRAFFKFFPPPVYLETRHGGLHISDDAVRIIQFVQGLKGLEVRKHGMRALPRGVVDAGFIKDEKALGTILKELVTELGITSVTASLPEEKMYLFKLDVPSLNEKEIRQTIEFKLEENVPLSPADAVFYFDIVPSPVAGSGKHTVMVSVAPRKVIDTYLSVLTGAGLTVTSFEVEARALARAFVPKSAPDCELIVNVMNHKTGLYIVSGGVVSFTSTVLWGGALVTEAIAKEFGKTPEEAELLKRNAGYHDAQDTKKVLTAVAGTVGVLQKEIEKVYSYWVENGEEGKPIDRVVLCGSDSLLVGLASHVTPNPEIPTIVADTWMNAFSKDAYIPPISHDESLDYAVAIGLALS
ncbi:MAG: type 4 fimbrial biosis protein PilM, type pilus assembly protein PilM [Candidatus Parcubacteria bacterium]